MSESFGKQVMSVSEIRLALRGAAILAVAVQRFTGKTPVARGKLGHCRKSIPSTL